MPPRHPPLTLAGLLRGALQRMRATPEFRDGLDRLGFEPIDEDEAAFAADVHDESERFRALVARLGPRAVQ